MLHNQRTNEFSCNSLVKFATLVSDSSSNILQISVAIFLSIAEPTKNKFGLRLTLANADSIRISAVRAVFQCSSAPAGSIPPFSSPNAR